jgi:hypothetical protein
MSYQTQDIAGGLAQGGQGRVQPNRTERHHTIE